MSATSPLLARFAAAMQRCSVKPGDRLAVALSGGPDSLALAALTAWWQGHVGSTQVRSIKAGQETASANHSLV